MMTELEAHVLVIGRPHLRVTHYDQETHRVNVVATCPYCGAETRLENLSGPAFLSWKNGTPIQRAFPDLSADDRQKLIDGICDECWKEAFGEEDRLH